MARRVVITGMGCITPIGKSVEEFTRSLKEGKSGAERITQFDPSNHAAQIACEVKGFDLRNYLGEKARDFKREARFSQFALAAAEEAMRNSGISGFGDLESSLRAGVVLGVGIGGLSVFEEAVGTLLQKAPDRVKPYTIPALMPNAAPAHVARRFGIHGPVYTVSTACSSGTDAIGRAFRELRNSNEYDIMLAGGAESTITPASMAAFGNMGALATNYNGSPEKASRPFDKDRSGFVMGEGAGVLVLESLDHARARGAKILAEVLGYGATNDAGHITAPNDSGEFATLAMYQAMQMAELGTSELAYINAHGTSTPLNDVIETRAMKRSLGIPVNRIQISSTKSMHGHTLGAAGAIELVGTIASLRAGFLPPTINLDNPDPECNLDYVPNIARQIDIGDRVAMSNTFGFGGHNSSLVVRPSYSS